MKTKSYEMDMCNGPLVKKILIFAIPLMFSSILQLLFNAVDMVIVGRYSIDKANALAAVGSTSSLINLLVNSFMGLSVGANVIVAQAFGAKDDSGIHNTIHTSILLSIVCGFILSVLGIVLARPLLSLMGTPDTVLGLSSTYMKIYFIGMPAVLLYNFGSSIMRAIGDTKKPLYFLIIAGIINVILNLIFVIGFKMSVDGVALATVISQCVSAILIIISLMKTEGTCKLYLHKLTIHRASLLKILKIGIPAGLQGAIFSISNVLIQSSINSFGDVCMAGNAATANVEGFIFSSMNAFHQAAVSFTSQNMGAKKYDRIKSVLRICLTNVVIVGCGLSLVLYIFRYPILNLYTEGNMAVTEYGIIRMKIIFPLYFLCGIMDVLVGSIRGLGFSALPMIVSLLGACAFRVIWIFTIFSALPTLTILYVSYPVSWAITLVVHFICFKILFNKLSTKDTCVI